MALQKYKLVGGDDDIKSKCAVQYVSDYEIKIKNELFDMNKNLIKTFDKYKQQSIHMLYGEQKQLKTLYDDIEIFNLYKYCKENYDQNLIKQIVFELNIRRYIQIYINKTYNLNISRGFCKMYDILNQFDLIDLTKPSVKTFHSCESPGHFINATNYWIKKHNPNYVYDWTGNSLNPYNKTIVDKL